MISISIYFIWYPEIPENTAYNYMIYITFFIVILVDKRGVREAKRERKPIPIQIRIQIRIQKYTHLNTTPTKNDTKNDTQNDTQRHRVEQKR